MSHTTVSLIFSDRWIDQHTAGRDDSWALSWQALRTVPAQWREAVWWAAHADCYEWTLVPTPQSWENGWAFEWILWPTGLQMAEALEARVGYFRRGWRPGGCQCRRPVPGDSPDAYADGEYGRPPCHCHQP